MSVYPSEFTIEEIINKIMAFNPVKISQNGETIWDDNHDVSVWKPIGEAFNDYYKNNPYFDFYMVTNINISITDYHHTIVDLYGYGDVEKMNKHYDEKLAAAGV